MIKRVSLHAKSAGVVPTGHKTFRREVAPSPRDITSPVTTSAHTQNFKDAAGSVIKGVYVNAPKPRPHILQGWKSPR